MLLTLRSTVRFNETVLVNWLARSWARSKDLVNACYAGHLPGLGLVLGPGAQSCIRQRPYTPGGGDGGGDGLLQEQPQFKVPEVAVGALSGRLLGGGHMKRCA